MKHKYKVKLREKEPSDEQIARHMDFSQVMGQYQKYTEPLHKKPLYKNPKAFLGLSLVLVVGYLVYLAFLEDGTETPSNGDLPIPAQEAAAPPPVRLEDYRDLGSSRETAGPQAEKNWDFRLETDLSDGKPATLKVPANSHKGALYVTFLQDARSIGIEMLALGTPKANSPVAQTYLHYQTANPDLIPGVLEIAGNYSTLFQLNSKTGLWDSIPNAIHPLLPSTQDAFEMVEMDKGATEVKPGAARCTVRLPGPGTYVLGKAAPQGGTPIVLSDPAGKRLTLSHLAVISPSGETRVIAARTDGAFEVSAADPIQLAYGLLPGGRVAILREKDLQGIPSQGAMLQAEIVAANNAESLKQALGTPP